MQTASKAAMSRLGCLWVPHFIARAMRQDNNIQLLLVVEGQQVRDASPDAAVLGVQVGEKMSKALARCPNARVVPMDRVRCQTLWECVLDALSLHTPAVEDVRWGMVYLDASGMDRLYGSEIAWCQAVRQAVERIAQMPARVGVAGSRFAAWLAAKSSESGIGVVEQADRAFLSPFPVAELPLSEEILRRLTLLGIRTIGKFARLPATSIAEQFGPEALQAHCCAKGLDNHPLSGQRREVLEVHLEFDVPETAREPLLASMLAASQKVLARLGKGGLAVRRVALELQVAEGKSQKHEAYIGGTLGKATFQATLQNLLAGVGGEGNGVISACLTFTGLESATGRQLDLFAHAEGHARLEETLRKLAQKHSPHCVVQARVQSPHALLLRDRYILEEVKP